MRPETASRRPRSDEAHFTYADLATMPDDHRRYEIIGGELVVTPSPVFRHQHVLARLFRAVDAHVERHELGVVLFAPFDVRFADTDVVEPDLLFLSHPRLTRVKQRYLAGPPELAVEVVSKGTGRRDRETKRALYEKFKVPHYWIVDPLERTLEENVLRGRRYVRRSSLEGKATFRPALFPGLAIRLGTIWA